jgi:4'-phosphopantetheinyl transferase EntD
MIEKLLPPGVVSTEAWSDEQSALIFPEERAQIGNAVGSRLQEFATCRSLARQALGQLGLPQTPILRGALGEPLWPPGVVGSITHCTGYRAAAIAECTRLASLGIDAEVHDALPPDVVESVLVEEEIAWLGNAPRRYHWDRVLFSAKESLYKAWFPLTQRWLDFKDVQVTVERTEGTFQAQPNGNMPEQFGQILSQVLGRFLICNDIIVTSAVLSANDPASESYLRLDEETKMARMEMDNLISTRA